MKNSQKNKSRLLIEFPRKILDAAVVNYMSTQLTNDLRKADLSNH